MHKLNIVIIILILTIIQICANRTHTPIPRLYPPWDNEHPISQQVWSKLDENVKFYIEWDWTMAEYCMFVCVCVCVCVQNSRRPTMRHKTVIKNTRTINPGVFLAIHSCRSPVSCVQRGRQQ
jgi:hypothetical protein